MKIEIPWYRRRPSSVSKIDTTIKNSIFDPNRNMNNRNRPNRQPNRQPNQIRNPVPVETPVSVPNPVGVGVNIPNPIGIGNPVYNPLTATPLPLDPMFFPPARPNPSLPTTTTPPIPLEPFFPDITITPQVPSFEIGDLPFIEVGLNPDTDWRVEFIGVLEKAAAVGGVTAKEIYEFVSTYDFSVGNMSDFHNAGKERFDDSVMLLVTAYVVSKQLVAIWGQRAIHVVGKAAAVLFSPFMTKDNIDYFKKYFGEDELM